MEELTVQITELEERRELLNTLLAEDALDQSPLSGDLPSPFYLDLVRDQLGTYLTNVSDESWKWSDKIDALLGAFHWPELYRETINDVVQRIAEQPEQYQKLFALEERFANLAQEPEDSPEVEWLAEDYAQSSELGQLQSILSTNTALGRCQLDNTLIDVATTLVSPAQRRFFEELSRKLNLSESEDY